MDSKAEMCAQWIGGACSVSEKVAVCRYHGADHRCNVAGNLAGKDSVKTRLQRGEVQPDLENPFMRRFNG